MGFLSGLCFCLEKRVRSAGDREEEADDGGEPFSFFFELQALQKTTDFFSESNKIGSGGFGDVYKAWTLFQDRMALNLVDPGLDHVYNPDEVAMCIQVGLLCCQESAEERPDMSSVHLMLSSDSSSSLPTPGKPPRGGFSYNDHYDNSICFSSIDEGR